MVLDPAVLCALALCVSGDPFQDSATLDQLINGRLQLGPTAGLPMPYRQRRVYHFSGPSVASLDASPERQSLSFNWCGGDEMIEAVEGATGREVLAYVWDMGWEWATHLGLWSA